MRKIAVILAVLLILGCISGCHTQPVPTQPSNPENTTPSGPAEEGTKENQMTNNAFQVRPDTVRFVGRYHIDMDNLAYGFYNVAAGIVFDCETTSLKLQMYANQYTEHWLNYVAVYIDDREPVSICVSGPDWYTVAEDLEPGVRHTVRVVKRSMTNGGAVFIQQVQLSENSRAWINEDVRPHRIQVLGDSISCGYGTLWDGTETEEVTVYQAGDQSFAVKLADMLNAELEVVAISGIGVGNLVNTPCPLMPHYKQEDMHNGVECDFSRYVPEVVVIALGTNDHGQNNPIDVFVNNSIKMIRFIREQYPDCMIVWTYGAMGAPYGKALEDMVAQLRSEGMEDVYYLPFVPSSDEPGAQHGHPGQLAHNRMARELAALISEKTGWPVTPLE